MPVIWIFLTTLWMLMMMFPNLISYFMWGLLLIVWVNLIMLKFLSKKTQDSYIKFWKYKMYKD